MTLSFVFGHGPILRKALTGALPSSFHGCACGWGNGWLCVVGGLVRSAHDFDTTRAERWICSEFACFWSGSSSLPLANHAGWQRTCRDHLADLAETVGMLGRVEGRREQGKGRKNRHKSTRRRDTYHRQNQAQGVSCGPKKCTLGPLTRRARRELFASF